MESSNEHLPAVTKGLRRVLIPLIDHYPNPVTHSHLENQFGPKDTHSDIHTLIRVTVCGIRRKFNMIGVPNAVSLIHKVGYRLNYKVANASTKLVISGDDIDLLKKHLKKTGDNHKIQQLYLRLFGDI